MSDEKYVGAVAAAKNVALVKAALDKKLDKEGGAITGSLKVDGSLDVGMGLDVKSSIEVENYIKSGSLLMAPSLALNDEAKDAVVYVGVAGENAAKVTSNGSDGKSRYARLAVGTPTGDNDAATKAYVDSKSGGVDDFAVTITVDTSAPTSVDGGIAQFNANCDKTFAEIKAAIDAGKNVFGSVSGNIWSLESSNDTTIAFAGWATMMILGDARSAKCTFVILSGGTSAITCPAGALPAPTQDGADNGKLMIVENNKWEMKTIANATDSASGLMPAADKSKLDGIAARATRTTVDGLLLDNSDNPVSNRVLKAALDAKAYKTVATGEANGLMSASDKSKLDGVEAGATKTIVDAALDAASENPVQNKAVKTALDGKAGTAVATTSANGLMSAADKTKLDTVEEGATKTTVDAALDASSTNPVQNKAVKAALDNKLSKSGGDVSGSLSLSGSITVGFTKADTGVHLYKDSEGVAKLTSGSADVDDNVAMARLKVAAPTDDDDAATKKYVDDRAVRYDAAQELEEAQRFQARSNIGAVGQTSPQFQGFVTLSPANATLGSGVGLSPTGSGHNYTLDISDVDEQNPTLLTGVATPTDASTDAAANVAYVKAKIAEVAASGGVDVDNALSATSTNPVQNKVVTAALASKAGTAVATTSAAGLMSKADKAKLDGIASGATKITIDSTMSGSSNNPVANHVVKQYVDDKVAAVGSNITVDAALDASSTNPVQNKAVKAALDGKLDKTGGTLTGNLTGKYITGTWLQSTAAAELGKTPGKIAVLDDSGWVYYRTPAELLADIGAAAAGHTHDCYTKAETDAAIAVRASTSAYGTTKLSNSVTSSSKTLAATPYAVKTALAQAKAYVDNAIAVAINSAY